MLRKKRKITLTIITAIVILCLINLYQVTANETGVGVINVPPEYSYIDIKHEKGLITTSLIISDYNSWNDIHSIQISIEYNDIETARFIFKQYETRQSSIKINQFVEPNKEQYLLIDQCSYSHSDESDTVSDRCLLDIEFVFYPLPCTQLSIITTDRGGLQAATYIDYTIERTLRSEQSITIPGIKTPINLHHITIDAFALSCAVTAVAYLFKHKKIDPISGRKKAYGDN